MTTEAPKMPRVITHANMHPVVDALCSLPCFQIGGEGDPPDWAYAPVVLEVPAGELAGDWLKAMALAGNRQRWTAPIKGDEGFAAQGLEGKVCIRTDLFGAVMSLRDIVPPHRGRILTNP